MFSRQFLDTADGKQVVQTWSDEVRLQNRRGTQQAILGVTDRLAVEDEIGAAH